MQSAPAVKRLTLFEEAHPSFTTGPKKSVNLLMSKQQGLATLQPNN